MTKSRENNDMTNYIGVVYANIEIELSGPIKLGVVSYKN